MMTAVVAVVVMFGDIDHIPIEINTTKWPYWDGMQETKCKAGELKMKGGCKCLCIEISLLIAR